MKMSRLQKQYSLAQGIYWGAGCALLGFVAVFLKEKGLSNTEIGLTAGFASLGSCLLSPVLSKIAARWNKVSIQQYLVLYLGIGILLYGVLSLIQLPAAITMLFFGLAFCLNISTNPFMSQVAMNYVQEGKPVNFGSARGIGSITYAAAAILYSEIASSLNVNLLGAVYGAGMIVLFILLLSMPQTYAAAPEKEEIAEEKAVSASEKTMFQKYPLFYLLLLGFGLCFMVSNCMQTYLVNIIESLGASTSLLGICLFMMAGSELPMMFLAPKLKKRFGLMPVLLFAALAYGCRNIFIATANSMVMLVIGLMFQGMSFGLFTAIMTDYAGSALAKEDRMLGQSWIAIATTGIGGTMGNLFGGMLQDTLGLSFLLNLCVLLTVLGILIVWGSVIKSHAVTFRNPVYHGYKSLVTPKKSV